MVIERREPIVWLFCVDYCSNLFLYSSLILCDVFWFLNGQPEWLVTDESETRLISLLTVNNFKNYTIVYRKLQDDFDIN